MLFFNLDFLSFDSINSWERNPGDIRLEVAFVEPKLFVAGFLFC